VRRALDWLTGAMPVAPAVPRVAFNLTVLSQMIGTPLMPDLAGHVLMLEDVGEYMYRIDRSLFHVTTNPAIRSVAGLKMGRFSAIPANDPDFVLDAEAVFRHWCDRSGIAWLGHANIGHDVENEVIFFG
jgi:muramoyltetrapeptide carboxypeptidase